MWRLHRYYLTELLASGALTFVVLFGVLVVSGGAVPFAAWGDLLVLSGFFQVFDFG